LDEAVQAGRYLEAVLRSAGCRCRGHEKSLSKSKNGAKPHAKGRDLRIVLLYSILYRKLYG
jgi:hypothetical protein